MKNSKMSTVWKLA